AKQPVGLVEQLRTLCVGLGEQRHPGPQRQLALVKSVAEISVQAGRAQRFLVVRRVVEILHIARLPREQAREYGRGRGGIDAAERVIDPASMLEGEPELRPDEVAQAGKLEPDGHITTSTERPAQRAAQIVDVRTILGEPALRRGRLPCLGCTGETRNEMPRM